MCTDRMSILLRGAPMALRARNRSGSQSQAGDHQGVQTHGEHVAIGRVICATKALGADPCPQTCTIRPTGASGSLTAIRRHRSDGIAQRLHRPAAWWSFVSPAKFAKGINGGRLGPAIRSSSPTPEASAVHADPVTAKNLH